MSKATKNLPLRQYIVKYTNGASYDVWAPKMGKNQLRMMFENDARAEKTELLSYQEV